MAPGFFGIGVASSVLRTPGLLQSDEHMSNQYYVWVPPWTEPGPLSRSDVELARMQCYMWSDWLDSGWFNTPYYIRFGSCVAGQSPPDTCIICFERLGPQSLFRRLPCQHVLHKPCADRWICLRDASCPVCRQTFYHLRRPFLVLVPITVPETSSCGGCNLRVPKASSFVSWWKRRFTE